MHDPPMIGLQVPAPYFAAFCLVGLALAVIAVVALLTIAWRASSINTRMERREREEDRRELRLRGVEDRVTGLEREMGRPLRAITAHDQG